MSQIHILDGQEDTILDFITLDNIIDDNHKKSLEDTLETYDFIAFGDKRYSEFLEKRNRVIIPDEDGTLREFIIFENARYLDTEGRKIQVFAHASYLELKKAAVVYPSDFKGTASQHGGRALNDTGWQMGIVEVDGDITININEHTVPYEYLKRIAKEFDGELNFRIEHDGRRITGRYVDILERVGVWQGREVEFGKDLDSIRRVEKQDIVTALMGLGPEREDGPRLEVLVEDFDALQRWGRIDKYGELQHLIEPYEIQSERSEMTDREARQYTRTALNKRINTQITYETTILDLEEVAGHENKKIRFGDTIKIKDTKFNPPLYLEARVFEMTRSIKRKDKKDIKLGDFIEHTEEDVNAIWNQLKKDIQNRVSFYEMAEYTYDKLTIDDKDETVFEDGKTFAEATGIKAEENAKVYADEQDAKIKIDVQEYADSVSEEKAQSALDSAKQYAVAKEVYENQMDKIAADIEDRAPLEYVDGKFTIVEDDLEMFNDEIEKKADGSSVYTISEVDNMINNTVSKTQYTADMNGVVTELESQGTRIGQNETAIGLKADSSELDAVENSLTNKIGNVEIKADSVITSVSEVRADLDGLEIGGRNYFSQQNYSHHSNAGYNPSTVTSAVVKVDPNTTYTVHFKSTESNRFGIWQGDLPNGIKEDLKNRQQIIGFRNISVGDVIKETFTTKGEGDYIIIYLSNERGDIKEPYLMVEKGNKATDWSPAPEETDEAISNVSGRVETLDGEIKAVAGEVSLKASQSVVDSLENRVSTAEGELSVLPGEIDAKVSKDGAFGELNLSPDRALLDFERVNVTGKLEAKHIKSLAGLNVNDQFVVDTSGKVTIGNNRVTIDDKSISITRPDGAIWMQDGLVKDAPSVQGINPMFMGDEIQSSGGNLYRSDAFINVSGYFRNFCGLLDGRTSGWRDVRDSNYRSSIRVQRYYFVHSARYLVLTYRSAVGSGDQYNGRNLHEHLALIYDSGDNKLIDRTIPTNTTATIELIVDLGKPTYENKWLDFRIGWAAGWGGKDDYIRFRINGVVQTDYI